MLGMSEMPGIVLIVDDDAAVRSALKFALEIEGFRVRLYAGSEAVLADLHLPRCCCLVVDYRMPLMDGLGFVTRLRKKEPGLYPPVVIVTGDYFVEETLTNELRTLGVEVRYKPLWLEDLVDLTRTLLAASRRDYTRERKVS